MRKLFVFKPTRQRSVFSENPSGGVFAWAMPVLFAVGVSAGGLIGLFAPSAGLLSSIEAFCSADPVPASAFAALWNSGKYFLCLAVASTSWIGLLLCPLLVLARGCLFGCGVSALYAAGAWKGLWSAALISGLPALVIIPCFLVLAGDSFLASRRLFALRFDRGAGLRRRVRTRHVPVAIGLICLHALYSGCLLPVLLGG